MKKRIAIIVTLLCFIIIGSSIVYANNKADVLTNTCSNTVSQAIKHDDEYELKHLLVKEKRLNDIKKNNNTIEEVNVVLVQEVTEEVVYEPELVIESTSYNQDVEEVITNVTYQEPTIEESIELEEIIVPEESEVNNEEVYTEEPIIEKNVIEEIEEEIIEDTAPVIQTWSIGIPDVSMRYYTSINSDQLYNSLQSLIDDGNIVKYNNYFAGHNPGAMGHLSGIGVGSIVRVSYNENEYYDYKIVEHTYASGSSFADVYIGGTTLWDIVSSNNFNYIVIQFCVGGENNFWLGEII